MKKYALTTATLLTALSGAALAADIGGGLNLSGNLGMVSEYYWRGQDQNRSDPAVQGGFDLAHDSGLYLGVWSSAAGGTASSEVDVYGGFAGKMGPVSYDVGMITYQYPGVGSPTNTNPSFEEAYLSLGTTVAAVDFGVKYYGAQSDDNDATEFSIGSEFKGVSASYTLGRYEKTGDYYSLTISKEVLAAYPIEIALTQTEMDFDSLTATDDDALIFSVSKGF
ncbi:MAG: TorF family putative porin [Proteobacteria bacterium]|nr:TorF family putative porin [Pseudomonadota bacterium]MDA1332479.1 TorF family putative porin [Pseudomonadota bacterium]